MKTSEIKQKLHNYTDTTEHKKLKAIYTILESGMDDETYNWTKDKEWLTELEKRGNELRTGKVKVLTWDEVKTRALLSIEQNKVKV